MWTGDIRQEVRKSPLHLQPPLFLFFSCRLFNFHAGWIANTHLFWAYLKTTGSAVVAMAALSGELDKLNMSTRRRETYVSSWSHSYVCFCEVSPSLTFVLRAARRLWWWWRVALDSLSAQLAVSFSLQTAPLTGRRPFINLFPRDVTNPECQIVNKTWKEPIRVSQMISVPVWRAGT